MAALDESGTLDVQTATIDGLIGRGLADPDFIKCDVENAERGVIEGARRLIARRHPVWLLETFDDDVLPLMESLGSVTHVHAEDGRIVRVSARTTARNYVFLP